ncbi:hypothetical protein O3M35_010772 [Rhynocoris fuscipes]|uniref:C2H2-type domain-containing protein n=1 Tax=Rhynocoris fuscipes TaxID=488301 RepID=A0AAW1D7C1_9HEMI
MDEIFERLKCYAANVNSIDDPFFDEGNEICQMYIRKGIIDEDEEDFCHQLYDVFKCEIPNCNQEFDTLLKYELHYNSCHRYSCSMCKKHLPSPHLLDLHLSETHDSFFKAAAERKPMYKCFIENCTVLSKNPEERRSHCIEIHKFPHDFRYDFKKTSGKKKKSKVSNAESMEVSTSIENTSTFDKNKTKNTAASIPGQFNFGHKKSGKVFNTKKNKNNSESMNMTELMESLPSEP